LVQSKEKPNFSQYKLSCCLLSSTTSQAVYFYQLYDWVESEREF